jgi:hypothetical protein
VLPHERSLEFARTSLLNYRNQDVIISTDWAGKPPILDQPILDQVWGSADLAPIQREWLPCPGNAGKLLSVAQT